MPAWSLEESLWRPVFALLLAAALPAMTLALLRRLLRWASGSSERLAPHTLSVARTASNWALLPLLWALGVTSLGPSWVGAPITTLSLTFAALTWVMADLGQPASEVDALRERQITRQLRHLAGRLKLTPLWLGPLLLSIAASDWLQLSPLGLVGSLLANVGAIAFGPLLFGVLTGALRPVSPDLKRLVDRITSGGRRPFWWVLAAGGKQAGFTQVCTLPWARTLLVSRDLIDRLDGEAIGALVARQTSYLYEPLWLRFSRLLPPALGLSMLTGGVRAALTLPNSADARFAWLFTSLMLATLLLHAPRGSRAREKKAHRWAADLSGTANLQAGLNALEGNWGPLGSPGPAPNRHSQTTSKEIDPALSRPSLARVRISGLAVSLLSCMLAIGIGWSSRIEEVDAPRAGLEAARWRQRIDPWDPHGMLALAWSARERQDLHLARVQLQAARAMGLAEGPTLELEAELLAAEGDCAGARETFEHAVSARSLDAFEDNVWSGTLPLGGFRMPPTLVTRCSDHSEGEETP